MEPGHGLALPCLALVTGSAVRARREPRHRTIGAGGRYRALKHFLLLSSSAGRCPDDNGPLGTPEGAQWPIVIAARPDLAVISGEHVQVPVDCAINAVKLDVGPGRDRGPQWTRSGAGLLSISSATFYQFGRGKPGKSDANVVRTDRKSPDVVTTDRKSRRRPVTGYGFNASLACRPATALNLTALPYGVLFDPLSSRSYSSERLAADNSKKTLVPGMTAEILVPKSKIEGR